MKDIRGSALISHLKALRPGLKIVAVGSRDRHPCEGADYQLESFDPKRLLALLQEMEPKATQEILELDAALAE